MWTNFDIANLRIHVTTIITFKTRFCQQENSGMSGRFHLHLGTGLTPGRGQFLFLSLTLVCQLLHFHTNIELSVWYIRFPWIDTSYLLPHHVHLSAQLYKVELLHIFTAIYRKETGWLDSRSCKFNATACGSQNCALQMTLQCIGCELQDRNFLVL